MFFDLLIAELTGPLAELATVAEALMKQAPGAGAKPSP